MSTDLGPHARATLEAELERTNRELSEARKDLDSQEHRADGTRERITALLARQQDLKVALLPRAPQGAQPDVLKVAARPAVVPRPVRDSPQA